MQSENAQALIDSTGHVNIGNLLKSDPNSRAIFDKDKMTTLLEKITGKTGATIDDVLSAGTKNSSNIRTANGGKELLVTLGDFTWSVVYVANSKNDGTGDPIITLWLTSSTQISEEYRNVEWNNFMATSMGTYPSNMYGTSMIRALALNNGGDYYADNAGNGKQTVVPTESHPFAKFTMPRSDTLKGSLIQYLEVPANVEWQGVEADMTNTFINDAYNKISGNFKSGQEKVQDCKGYDAWKNDYLWLPSMTELGWGAGAYALWQTSAILSADATPFWVRSASLLSFSQSYTVPTSGNSHTHTNVKGTSYSIRPAIHLNLSKVFNNPAEPPDQVTIDYAGKQLSVEDLSDDQKSWYDNSQIDLDYLGSERINVGTFKVKATIKPELQAEEVKFDGTPDTSKGETDYIRYFDFVITEKTLRADFNKTVSPPTVKAVEEDLAEKDKSLADSILKIQYTDDKG
ncbi:MAG: hypothetical protein K2N32_04455, partial [Clostridia bacterium]|nr:hypothetical protein [Clostridia bacterium]